MESYVNECLEEHIQVVRTHQRLISKRITAFSEKVITTFRTGNKVLLVGNGGSAADAQHLAAEFVGRFRFDRPSLPAMALGTDTSILTAVGNDMGFESIFSRQIESLGNSGDVLIAISTSGSSPNVVKAVEEAKGKQMYTIGFLGKNGGLLKGIVDDSIIIESEDTARIQETHITMGHILCDIVEKKLYAK